MRILRRPNILASIEYAPGPRKAIASARTITPIRSGFANAAARLATAITIETTGVINPIINSPAPASTRPASSQPDVRS